MDGAVVTRNALLGVERSVTGRRWLDCSGDARTAMTLAQRFALPEVVGQVLAARDIGPDDAASFLEPRLSALLPDPSHLKDMDLAVARLLGAIEQGEKIAVFGDYDVDGATSSALLLRFLRAVGSDARIYIPDRQKEGYGPNAPALGRLKADGARVVVTVDCGTTAHEALSAPEAAGLDILVIDHHEAESGLPPVYAVVNPNRLDEDSVHGHMAAVGVTFLLVVALNRALREAGWYDSARRREPNLMSWLDLVALGTVCDVVPLKGVNRALVTQGLKIVARRSNVGLAALADVAGLDETPGAYHLGFVLGPRVNAGGRVGEAGLGAQLLATDDPSEAREIARKLHDFNHQRRDIEEKVLHEALERAEVRDSGSLMLVAGEGWHPGVIGIVASRLRERYDLPACVVALADGKGLGSGRSIPGVDLGAAVIAARQKGLLINGGGHSMAAGFTVAASGLDALDDFLGERLARQIGEQNLVPSLHLDGALAVSGVTPDLIEALERLAPFGSGNAEPRFAVAGARIGFAKVAGTDHVSCSFTDPGGARLAGIAFRCLDGPLGKFLLGRGDLPVHVAGKLRMNRWQGRSSPQIIVDDAAPAG